MYNKSFICLDLGSTEIKAAVSTNTNPILIPIQNDLEKLEISNNSTKDSENITISKIYTSGIKKDSSLKPLIKDQTVFTVGGKKCSYLQLVSFLRKINGKAQKLIDSQIEGIIISTPVDLNQNKHDILREAAIAAGFKRVRLLDEASSLAISYFNISDRQPERIVVLTLGGKNFNIALFDLGNELVDKLSGSRLQIGGNDFDQILIDWLNKSFANSYGFKLPADKSISERIKTAAENAKITLSSASYVDINLPYLIWSNNHSINFETTLNEDQFNSMIRELLKSIEKFIRAFFSDLDLLPTKVTKVILAGKTSRIPAYQKMIKGIFKEVPIKIHTEDDVVLRGLNVLANILLGKRKDILMLDAIHHSIGIENKHGLTETLIKKDTTIPVKASKIFTTAVKDQKTITLHLVQGENKISSENFTLDKIHLSEIKPIKRGLAQIKVTFDIDQEGTLNTYIDYLGNTKTSNEELPALDY